jgi:Mrp family chromosome partitioning ATPase
MNYILEQLALSFNFVHELLFRLSRRTPKPASFERIRIRILSKWLLNKKENCTVIAFTSRLPGEGVSTVVAGLARSFSTAEIGKILVLDVSNSRFGVSRLLNITNLAGFSDLPGYVTRDEKLDIDVITLANDTLSSNGAEQHTVSLRERLLEKYNIILVDAGPLSSASGAYWLANSDYNVLVIDSTKTTRESLEYQQKEFENSNITIDGSILNKREFPIPGFLYWLAR